MKTSSSIISHKCKSIRITEKFKDFEYCVVQNFYKNPQNPPSKLQINIIDKKIG